eukprot:CAMPEP_0198141206 /NCGR_PEP_ID=MMETSP1443-20131203/4231_1 /TAXON_ID=186043 /ORGANISM="Entomoneis sp., Strain CCMP2396" /LENGTH=314 /DNA_ID=CAMNT_0043803871 /DNA_START=45 /DNA_END=989 /DNA_ORIENTATION=-
MATPASLAPALLFDEQAETSVTNVIVHPLVLLHVLDHHTRRQEESGRVIGTLLGRRDGNTVEVTNCFAVPHAERGEEVAIGKDFNKRMLSLYMRSNRRESVVGWYASAASGTGPNATASPLIADTSSLIHEFYAGETDENDPVHLVVDTRLVADQLSIRAYKSTQVVVQGESVGSLFHEVRLALKSNEPETICLNEMIKSQTNALAAGKESKEDEIVGSDASGALLVSMKKLFALVESTLEYVDSVVDGKVTADPEVGRQLADTLASVPRIRPDVFDTLFHDSLQDLLMVTYLSNITRTQIAFAEKLNSSLGAE